MPFFFAYTQRNRSIFKMHSKFNITENKKKKRISMQCSHCIELDNKKKKNNNVRKQCLYIKFCTLWHLVHKKRCFFFLNSKINTLLTFRKIKFSVMQWHFFPTSSKSLLVSTYGFPVFFYIMSIEHSISCVYAFVYTEGNISNQIIQIHYQLCATLNIGIFL